MGSDRQAPAPAPAADRARSRPSPAIDPVSPGPRRALAHDGRRIPAPEGDVPHRATMEQVFGEDLGSVRSRVGVPLAAGAARPLAAAEGERIAFASSTPSPALVAHEVAHVVQQRHAGGSTERGLSRRGDAAEREADQVASAVARDGAAAATARPRARPAGRVSLYAGEHETLTDETIQSLGDLEVQEAALGARTAQAGGHEAGPAANLRSLQWELAGRELTEEGPASGSYQVWWEYELLSDDPVHLRFQLERYLATHGTGGLRSYVSRFEHWVENPDEHDAELAQLDRELGDFGQERGNWDKIAADHAAAGPGEISGGMPASEEMLADLDTRQAEVQARRDQRSASNAEGAAQAAPIVGLVREVANGLLAERKTFADTFGAEAKRLTYAVLDESERRILGELERYGISSTGLFDQVISTVVSAMEDRDNGSLAAHNLSLYRVSNDAEHVAQRKAMMEAAGGVAQAETSRRAAEQQLEGVRLTGAYARVIRQMMGNHDPYAGADDSDEVVVGGAQVCAPEDDEALRQDVIESLEHAVAESQRTVDERRARAEADFPVIATYTSGDRIDLEGLNRMTTAPDLAAIGADAYEKLANIQRVRDELDSGDLDVWKRPEIVALTAQRVHVAPGSWQARVVAEEQAREEGGWAHWAILAVTIGLALVAAIPTAGGSLALTAVVIGAEIAGIALDLYLLSETLGDYDLAMALTNTDFDRARLLSHDEPSLFWLALDLVGTAIGVGGAFKTFKDIARVRRAASAARTAVDFTAKLDEARLLARAAGLSSEAEERLIKQILASHPDSALVDDVLGALGRTDDVIAPAAEAAGRVGRGLTEVADASDVAALSRELGAVVQIVPDLDEAIRVVPKIGRRGQVGVEVVLIGERAMIGDILAHREVLGLMRRYDGMTAEAAALWDDLLATTTEASGRINPFPAGSQAHQAWFELRKYPQLIADRIERLGADGLTRESAAALREDLRFFQTELAVHGDVVRNRVLEAGQDFVARAARSNEAAFAAKYPRDFVLEGRKFEIGGPDSSYYYALDPRNTGEYVLRRYVDAVDAPAARVGLENGVRVVGPGDLSRTEQARALVASWAPELQSAYAEAGTAAIRRYGDELYKVVPLQGLAKVPVDMRNVIAPMRDEMVAILTRGLEPAHGARAAALAEEAVERLASHQIVVIRGTDQLRAFGYRANFEDVTGKQVLGDLHHLIPLYLGGSHVPGRAGGALGNLLDLEAKAHDELHALIETMDIADEVTLAPHAVGRLPGLNFSEGVGILLRNGEIRIEPVHDAAARLADDLGVCE